MLYDRTRSHTVFGPTRTALAREDGQALVEYALIVSLIAVVSATILLVVGGKVAGLFSQIASGF